jgi:hypothetical protein
MSKWGYSQIKSIESTDGRAIKQCQVFGEAKVDINEDIKIFISKWGWRGWELVAYTRQYIVLDGNNTKEEVFIFKRLI